MLSLNIPPWKLSGWFRRPKQRVTGDWQLHHLLMHHVLCRVLAKHQITRVTQPLYSPDLVPCNFWLFPKLSSSLKGKRFQTVGGIQENRMGQLMMIGRIVWGPEVPNLKGTEVSLSYIQCFLYLVSSSINVSIFMLHVWVPSGQTLCVCVTV